MTHVYVPGPVTTDVGVVPKWATPCPHTTHPFPPLVPRGAACRPPAADHGDLPACLPACSVASRPQGPMHACRWWSPARAAARRPPPTLPPVSHALHNTALHHATQPSQSMSCACHPTRMPSRTRPPRPAPVLCPMLCRALGPTSARDGAAPPAAGRSPSDPRPASRTASAVAAAWPPSASAGTRLASAHSTHWSWEAPGEGSGDAPVAAVRARSGTQGGRWGRYSVLQQQFSISGSSGSTPQGPFHPTDRTDLRCRSSCEPPPGVVRTRPWQLCLT